MAVDEQTYVRLYRRETPEWCLLSWQARALFYELLRRVDLAGYLHVGRAGLRGVAALVRMPLDVVVGALGGEDGLLAHGLVVKVERGYIIPDFVESQPLESGGAQKRWSRAAYETVHQRDGRCRYCGSLERLTIDHVIPRCQGGRDDESNLVVACRSCNSRKGGRTPSQAGMAVLQ
jgi:hypothetical protein